MDKTRAACPGYPRINCPNPGTTAEAIVDPGCPGSGDLDVLVSIVMRVMDGVDPVGPVRPGDANRGTCKAHGKGGHATSGSPERAGVFEERHGGPGYPPRVSTISFMFFMMQLKIGVSRSV